MGHGCGRWTPIRRDCSAHSSSGRRKRWTGFDGRGEGRSGMVRTRRSECGQWERRPMPTPWCCGAVRTGNVWRWSSPVRDSGWQCGPGTGPHCGHGRGVPVGDPASREADRWTSISARKGIGWYRVDGSPGQIVAAGGRCPLSGPRYCSRTQGSRCTTSRGRRVESRSSSVPVGQACGWFQLRTEDLHVRTSAPQRMVLSNSPLTAGWRQRPWRQWLSSARAIRIVVWNVATAEEVDGARLGERPSARCSFNSPMMIVCSHRANRALRWNIGSGERKCSIEGQSAYFAARATGAEL